MIKTNGQLEEMKRLVDRLESRQWLEEREFEALIENCGREGLADYLFQKSDCVRRKHFGNRIYIRGLIEFTNYCKNDCFYCGIRRSNQRAARFRLSKDEILSCCERGYGLGFRTFVLQGGEDGFFDDDRMGDIISAIRTGYEDCAITLSVGEKSRESYQRYFDAGANRFLLRHETADSGHYGRLHPEGLTLENRKECLYNLKDIGFQVGCGFMAGSPGQTSRCLARDMEFLHELKPHMVGIGPFIPHKDTPFGGEPAGGAELTLFMLGLVRLMLPKSLLPATTALGTIVPGGRERGILAGANVVMPNLSPNGAREKYQIYDNKLYTGCEGAEGLNRLKESMEAIGFQIAAGRGDAPA